MNQRSSWQLLSRNGLLNPNKRSCFFGRSVNGQKLQKLLLVLTYFDIIISFSSRFFGLTFSIKTSTNNCSPMEEHQKSLRIFSDFRKIHTRKTPITADFNRKSQDSYTTFNIHLIIFLLLQNVSTWEIFSWKKPYFFRLQACKAEMTKLVIVNTDLGTKKCWHFFNTSTISFIFLQN